MENLLSVGTAISCRRLPCITVVLPATETMHFIIDKILSFLLSIVKVLTYRGADTFSTTFFYEFTEINLKTDPGHRIKYLSDIKLGTEEPGGLTQQAHTTSSHIPIIHLTRRLPNFGVSFKDNQYMMSSSSP